MEIYKDIQNRVEVDLKFVRPTEVVAFKGSASQKLAEYTASLAIMVAVTYKGLLQEPTYIPFTSKDEAKKPIQEYLAKKFLELGISSTKLTKFEEI